MLLKFFISNRKKVIACCPITVSFSCKCCGNIHSAGQGSRGHVGVLMNLIRNGGAGGDAAYFWFYRNTDVKMPSHHNNDFMLMWLSAEM